MSANQEQRNDNLVGGSDLPQVHQLVDEQRDAASHSWIETELEQLAGQNRKRTLRLRESPHVAGMVQLDGRQLADFGSNDYLGIAADVRLIEAVRRAVSEHGWGSGASPLVSGYGVLHRRLEGELAKFEETEACCLFPSGFAANVAALTSLCGAGDLILSDELNHASIVDGCRLSRARTMVYRHADCGHLLELLKQRDDYRRCLIVTDSLFSMDGDFAPLPELVEASAKHDCMLMVDEAHATGVWGTHGRGVAELFDVEQQIPVRVGTLSKALGSIGGFVAGSAALIELIRNRGRSYMFSTALPEAAAAASLAALEIVRTEAWRRARVRELSERFCRPSSAANSTSQIVPIVTGLETSAIESSRRLMEQGLFVPAIRPPAVADGACRLRISFSAAHSDQQVLALSKQLKAIGLRDAAQPDSHGTDQS